MWINAHMLWDENHKRRSATYNKLPWGKKKTTQKSQLISNCNRHCNYFKDTWSHHHRQKLATLSSNNCHTNKWRQLQRWSCDKRRRSHALHHRWSSARLHRHRHAHSQAERCACQEKSCLRQPVKSSSSVFRLSRPSRSKSLSSVGCLTDNKLRRLSTSQRNHLVSSQTQRTLLFNGSRQKSTSERSSRTSVSSTPTLKVILVLLKDT